MPCLYASAYLGSSTAVGGSVFLLVTPVSLLLCLKTWYGAAQTCFTTVSQPRNMCVLVSFLNRGASQSVSQWLGTPASHRFVYWFSNCGPWSGNISIIWELARKTNSWALSQTYWMGNSERGAHQSLLTSPPGDSAVSWSLRTAALMGWF